MNASPENRPSSADPDLNRLATTVRGNRKTLNRLKERVALLERALEIVCHDPQMQWLYRNRSERMDPTVPVFPELRSEFHRARYRFAAERVCGLSVADIACGTGYGCRMLLDQGGATRVRGVDICRETIEYARNRHAREGIDYVVADAADSGLAEESLDCVVSFETIEHVPDDEALLAEFRRILKPGGLLICSTPNAWPLEIAPHHVREYDRESFTRALSVGFEIGELFNQNSGSDFLYNHDQPAGIVPTTDANHRQAECFLAVARRVARN